MAGNRASRLDAAGQGFASLTLPKPPFVATPTNKRVIDAADLAKWNEEHHRKWTEWAEQVNTVLQRFGS